MMKENDLLKLWLMDKELEEKEIVEDFKFVLPLLFLHKEAREAG